MALVSFTIYKFTLQVLKETLEDQISNIHSD